MERRGLGSLPAIPTTAASTSRVARPATGCCRRCGRCYAGLHLVVNEAKTAVAPVWGRKFWATASRPAEKREAGRCQPSAGQTARPHPAPHAPRQRSQSEADRRGPAGLRAGRLEGVLWLAPMPTVMRNSTSGCAIDCQAVQLKQWKRGTTAYRELRKLGAHVGRAQRVASPAPVVAHQRAGHQPSAGHRLAPTVWACQVLLTSTSRTAWCGPATPVVWEGCQYAGPIDGAEQVQPNPTLRAGRVRRVYQSAI